MNGTNNSSRCNIGVNKLFISSSEPTTKNKIISLNEKTLNRKIKQNGDVEFYKYEATFKAWDFFEDEKKYIRWLNAINRAVASKKTTLAKAVWIYKDFEKNTNEEKNKKPILTLEEMAKMASDMPVPF